MENENLEKRKERLRRYQVIIDYHKKNPFVTEVDRKYLRQIKDILSPFNSFYLVTKFGRKIANEFKGLVHNLDSDLSKLLAQN